MDVTGDVRLEEIARMLSGAKITAESRQAASILLSSSAQSHAA
jgi:DNA repair ATPase RecN